jgi:hypothetical protein
MIDFENRNNTNEERLMEYPWQLCRSSKLSALLQVEQCESSSNFLGFFFLLSCHGSKMWMQQRFIIWHCWYSIKIHSQLSSFYDHGQCRLTWSQKRMDASILPGMMLNYKQLTSSKCITWELNICIFNCRHSNGLFLPEFSWRTWNNSDV